MRFKRGSAPEDRCFYCREFCGVKHPKDTGGIISGHSRFAHWMPSEQRHIEVSAHAHCFYDAEMIPANAKWDVEVERLRGRINPDMTNGQYHRVLDKLWGALPSLTVDAAADDPAASDNVFDLVVDHIAFLEQQCTEGRGMLEASRAEVDLLARERDKARAKLDDPRRVLLHETEVVATKEEIERRDAAMVLLKTLANAAHCESYILHRQDTGEDTPLGSEVAAVLEGHIPEHPALALLREESKVIGDNFDKCRLIDREEVERRMQKGLGFLGVPHEECIKAVRESMGRIRTLLAEQGEA